MNQLQRLMNKLERRWNTSLVNQAPRRKSELCKAKDMQANWYKRWCTELNEKPRFHRKQWEFVYELQALWERDCIATGKKGLAFAVGSEPIPSILANYGCDIVATDIEPELGQDKGWQNGELCVGLESLNTRGLCTDEVLRKQVRYKAVDMNDIPPELTGFDFTWSSCSFEHLGSIEKGIDFLENHLHVLKPGGWAVHTTEFNISSNDLTTDNANTVIFRMQDIEKMVSGLEKKGHHVEERDYSLGGLPEDFQVDIYPHKQDVHLKLQLNEFVVTSIGIIIRKSSYLDRA